MSTCAVSAPLSREEIKRIHETARKLFGDEIKGIDQHLEPGDPKPSWDNLPMLIQSAWLRIAARSLGLPEPMGTEAPL